LLTDFSEPGAACHIGTGGRQESTADFSYHNLPEKRKEVELDGLISCGAVGYLDAGDFLYVCDRKRDRVISGGVNIYPAEIEAVLINCPGVKDCAVFGIPDAEFGESLGVCVEPMPGASINSTDVHKYLQSHIAGFKVPRKIEMLDSLPREDSGKIFKRMLRDPYWEGAGRLI
jgi:long-chain acyl-CoA synthetase